MNSNTKIDLVSLCIIDALALINYYRDSGHYANRPVYNVEDKIFAVRCDCGNFHPVFQDQTFWNMNIPVKEIIIVKKLKIEDIFLILEEA